MPLPSGFEWVLIIGLALLILGPGKLPEVAASLGKSIREFRKASADVADAVRVDAAPASGGPAAVTQASAPAQTAAPAQPSAAAATVVASTAEPQPNVLQSGAEPNVLTPTEAVADAAATDVAPKADG
jgi:TatA/E family protein of Tat protein translocase